MTVRPTFAAFCVHQQKQSVSWPKILGVDWLKLGWKLFPVASVIHSKRRFWRCLRRERRLRMCVPTSMTSPPTPPSPRRAQTCSLRPNPGTEAEPLTVGPCLMCAHFLRQDQVTRHADFKLLRTHLDLGPKSALVAMMSDDDHCTLVHLNTMSLKRTQESCPLQSRMDITEAAPSPSSLTSLTSLEAAKPVNPDL